MATYNKTKTGGYKLNELQVSINADATIVPSCTEITGNGTALALEFAASLSAGEETSVDTIISNHTRPHSRPGSDRREARARGAPRGQHRNPRGNGAAGPAAL